MTNLEALKKLAAAIGCAETAEDVQGETIAEVLDFMADNYPKPQTVSLEETG